MVSLLSLVLFAFGFLSRFIFLLWDAVSLPVTLIFIILYNLASCILTEQEASKLRSFVDEPAFTDLHWV